MLKPEEQFLLPQSTALYSRMGAAFTRAVGLHPSRFRVLYLLHVLGEATPSALAWGATMDAAALTRILNDFEAKALLARRPDPADARQRLVSLTEAGRRLIAAKVKRRDAFVREALAGLSAAEMTAMSELMARVEANFSRIAGLEPIGDALNIDPARRDAESG